VVDGEGKRKILQCFDSDSPTKMVKEKAPAKRIARWWAKPRNKGGTCVSEFGGGDLRRSEKNNKRRIKERIGGGGGQVPLTRQKEKKNVPSRGASERNNTGGIGEGRVKLAPWQK